MPNVRPRALYGLGHCRQRGAILDPAPKAHFPFHLEPPKLPIRETAAKMESFPFPAPRIECGVEPCNELNLDESQIHILAFLCSASSCCPMNVRFKALITTRDKHLHSVAIAGSRALCGFFSSTPRQHSKSRSVCSQTSSQIGKGLFVMEDRAGLRTRTKLYMCAKGKEGGGGEYKWRMP